MDEVRYLPNAGEFSEMETWDRCYWLSRAYIEASGYLCQAMLAEEFSNQYSSSRVILHLARHGIELFLKSSIIAATGVHDIPGHDLAKLFERYLVTFQGDEFHFVTPPQFALTPGDDLFRDELAHFHSTLDQRHRYPADRKGQDFTVPEVFDARLFLNDVTNLKRQLTYIEFAHIRPAIKQTKWDQRS